MVNECTYMSTYTEAPLNKYLLPATLSSKSVGRCLLIRLGKGGGECESVTVNMGVSVSVSVGVSMVVGVGVGVGMSVNVKVSVSACSSGCPGCDCIGHAAFECG